MAEVDRDDLIQAYFHMGFSYIQLYRLLSWCCPWAPYSYTIRRADALEGAQLQIVLRTRVMGAFVEWK